MGGVVTMSDIFIDVMFMNKKQCIDNLKHKYVRIIKCIESGEGCYVWGSGKLGKFCLEQLTKNGIAFKGFVDNNQSNWDDELIFSPERVKKSDVVIVASIYYPQIIKQLKKLGNNMCLYYEEFAYIMDGFENYYPTFDGIFDEFEKNKKAYLDIFNVLNDSVSKEVYENILRFRMTLNHCYTNRALEISLIYGMQDFDKEVVRNFNEDTCFYDVGGYDGQSTLDFISQVRSYNKIFFFEPDGEILSAAKERLKKYSNIEFIQAVVGNDTMEVSYDAKGGGAGCVSDTGQEMVRMICLDDFIQSSDCYVKLDVEGFEFRAMQGCKTAIEKYKPMLSVSLYHKPGDIHILINQILSWNPSYKIYIRHYTETYADTRAYFIDDTSFHH